MNKNNKIVLAIESSCDETSAAIGIKRNDRVQILSNIISSSLDLHAKYGGVIPEQAAREQLKLIIPVIKESLEKANITPSEIDAIAVTYGPGLIGSLLVGVETAKVLSTVWDKPIIPVNHLLGHLYANWIEPSTELNPHFSPPTFPCIGLLVSGGHTDLVLFTNQNEYQYLGGTRDDAAGECFDKCARILGFSYPGGPKISKLAEMAENKKIILPQPMVNSGDFDFSFSGLKTAFVNLVEENFTLDRGHFNKETSTWEQKTLEEQLDKDQIIQVNNLCYSLQEAIVKILTKKTIAAAKKYNINQIIVAGGVAANKRLAEHLKESFSGTVLIPPANLCTDNAAMIAAAALMIGKDSTPDQIQTNPNLSLSS